MDFPGRVGKVVNFEASNKVVDPVSACQQRRDGDDCAQIRRHAVAQIEARQEGGPEAMRDASVDQHQRRIDGRQQTDQCHRRQPPANHVNLRQHEQRQKENDDGGKSNTDRVAGEPGRHEATAQSQSGWTIV